jgi:hypothetical protein
MPGTGPTLYDYLRPIVEEMNPVVCLSGESMGEFDA